MIKANIDHKRSIKDNLEQWCYERETRFEIANEEAAKEFMSLLEYPFDGILELGCGDGAAAQYFVAENKPYLGVDINQEKLDRNPGKTYICDMNSFLSHIPDNFIQNIFTHHALEHTIKAKEVLNHCARVLVPGGIFYAIVPANDHLHTVHHVVFEDAYELLPVGLVPIFVDFQERQEPEYKCIAQKPFSSA